MFLLVSFATILDVAGISLESIWSSEPRSLRTGWTLAIDDRIVDRDFQLPHIYRESSLTNKRVVLSRVIPDDVSHLNSLMMRASQKTVVVAVEGETIYQYDGNLENRRIKVPGYLNHFAWLDEDAVGKELRIETVAHSERTSGTFYEVFLGSRISQIGVLFRYDGFSLVVGALMLLTSIVVAFLSVTLFRRLEVRHSAISFAGIELCVGLWLCGGSMSTQLLIHNQLILLFAGMVALFLLPLFLTRFVSFMYHIPQSMILNRVVLLFPVGFIVVSLLQLADVITYYDVLTPAAIALFVYLMVLIWFAVRAYLDGNVAIKDFLVAIACLSVSVTGELILLLLPFMTLLNALVLNLGIIAFGTVLLRQVLMLVMKFVEKKGRDEYLESIALLDALTNLANRRAFDEHMDELRTHDSDARSTGVVVFDVNDLKRVNDEEGHAAGDELLKRVASNLSKWFGHIGRIYRIGGDEFAMICDACTPADLSLVSRRIEVELSGKQDAALDIAYGSARLDPEEGLSSIDEVFKVADMRMYRQKAAMKASFVR